MICLDVCTELCTLLCQRLAHRASLHHRRPAKIRPPRSVLPMERRNPDHTLFHPKHVVRVNPTGVHADAGDPDARNVRVPADAYQGSAG